MCACPAIKAAATATATVSYPLVTFVFGPHSAYLLKMFKVFGSAFVNWLQPLPTAPYPLMGGGERVYYMIST